MTEQQTTDNTVDKKIVSFLQSQTALTLATSINNEPYCSSCFYAYSDKLNLIVFKSSPETKHVIQGLENERVALSVLPDKLVTGKVQGIQLSGSFFRPDGEELAACQRVFYKKYPFAMAIGGELWAVRPKAIKFTDSTLGFGKKVLWEAADQH